MPAPAQVSTSAVFSWWIKPSRISSGRARSIISSKVAKRGMDAWRAQSASSSSTRPTIWPLDACKADWIMPPMWP